MRFFKTALVLALVFLPLHSASAIVSYMDTWLADYTTDFQAYDYNTGAYWDATLGYVGCGPTTGAMILNYFENHYGATGIMEAGGGLATAWSLHGTMGTGTNGFGSPFDIEPGMEGYAVGKSHEIDVMFHASDAYTPGTADAAWLDDYGDYGESWNNDGDFWDYNGSNWEINDLDFFDFAAANLTAGIPIWLAVDSDGDFGGDHWVPMVGADNAGTYYYYDTWTTTLQSATISAVWEEVGAWGISGVRTVEYIGATGGGDDPAIPEPATLVLFGTGLLGLARFGRKFRK